MSDHSKMDSLVPTEAKKPLEPHLVVAFFFFGGGGECGNYVAAVKKIK